MHYFFLAHSQQGEQAVNSFLAEKNPPKSRKLMTTKLVARGSPRTNSDRARGRERKTDG